MMAITVGQDYVAGYQGEQFSNMPSDWSASHVGTH